VDEILRGFIYWRGGQLGLCSGFERVCGFEGNGNGNGRFCRGKI
jgi:hypothetical protein